MTDSKTHDIAAFLSGGTYPTKDIPISLDGPSLIELHAIEKRLSEPTESPEASAVLEETRSAIIERIRQSTFTVRIMGMPTKVRKDLLTKVMSEMPDVDNVAPEGRDDFYTELLWDAYITEIVAPDGTVTRPDRENIKQFRSVAPDYAHTAITAGIQDLDQESQIGYYALVTSADFLSKPSLEG